VLTYGLICVACVAWLGWLIQHAPQIEDMPD
jgi:hypothetical protein